MSTTDKQSYGTYAAMTTTNLVANTTTDSTDTYTAWQSDRVDNQTATLADDYEVIVRLPITTGTIANDAAAYVYIVPWMTTDGGSTWKAGASFGTTTEPTGAEGAAIISEPNSMRGPIAIPYKVQSQVGAVEFNIAQFFNGSVPDGWSLVIRNNCGINSVATPLVAYRPIFWTNG